MKLFDSIIENYRDTEGNLYLFLDNARYYKSLLLQEALKIELFFKEELKLPIMKDKLRQFASDNFHIHHRELCYFPSPYDSFRLNFFGR